MQLSEFILENIEPILVEWEAFARSLLSGASMTSTALRDHAELILRAAARDMQAPQTPEQRASKSKGQGGAGGEASDGLDNASHLHGADRVGAGFHITEVVAEYRALRASVHRLWTESLPSLVIEDFKDIARFDESLDQSLASAVASYSKRIDESRKMFLAILSHDLRNPVHCIRMATHVISATKGDADLAEPLSLIESSTETMTRLISDLIDFSSTGLGQTLPLNREPVNLIELCREVVASYRATHPGRVLRFYSEGDVNGVWDAGRLRQLISNLLGNALQHGSAEGPVELSVRLEGPTPEASAVVLSVHSEGAPIRPEILPTIFDPLKRYATRESASQRTPGSIGLGLYIVREIVTAKGGTVDVESTAEKGTTFTVRIPRFVRD
jgi:signal transduction histidine kinase